MRKGSAVSYRVFVRDWWRNAGPGEPRGYMGGLVPYPGAPKRTIARGCTEEEAQEICEQHAATHEPGRFSRKAEYERES
jgi:hypothetical protein